MLHKQDEQVWWHVWLSIVSRSLLVSSLGPGSPTAEPLGDCFCWGWDGEGGRGQDWWWQDKEHFLSLVCLRDSTQCSLVAASFVISLLVVKRRRRIRPRSTCHLKGLRIVWLVIMDGNDGSETIGLGVWQEKNGWCLVFSQCCGVDLGQGYACYISVCLNAVPLACHYDSESFPLYCCSLCPSRKRIILLNRILYQSFRYSVWLW